MMLKPLIRTLVPAQIWAAGRRIAQRRHLKTFNRRVVEHTYHGQQLRVLLADALGEGWYDHDWPAQAEIDRLAQLKLRAGATVFDCGAHQGVVALVLARIAGPQGRVIAVEANDHNIAVARENVRLNPGERASVELVHAAVAAIDGSITFSDDFNGQLVERAGRSGRRTVPALTLNTLVERYGAPDVVFIDIEGAEWQALQAAGHLFADNRRPDCFIEVHAGAGLEALGGSASQIVQFFQTRGYAVQLAEKANGPFVDLNGQALPSSRFFMIATASSTEESVPSL